MSGIQLKDCESGTLLPNVQCHVACAAFPGYAAGPVGIPPACRPLPLLALIAGERLQQFLALKLPVANPVLTKDLVPCEMWSC